MEPTGTVFTLEVRPALPTPLARLKELAADLRYSWDLPTRSLFARLNPALWEACGHNPRAFLNQIDQQRLADAAEDPIYLADYHRVLTAYESYINRRSKSQNGYTLGQGDMVAYFCFEFGFHESLPIYSGGLGILAGDHCKAASDVCLPFVGVGLLYRQGYFTQTIDNDGNQHATYHDADFSELPVESARTADGNELRIRIDIAGRSVEVKPWIVVVGHVKLVLLDTDLPENSEHDRFITHQLYGGDRVTRIEQEIVLGVAGVRALEALGINPTVWHMNEGHAAFLVLERVRARIKQGIDFQTALEAVACSTIFTTHTAVPAGHDHFSDDMMSRYFDGYCREAGIDLQRVLALGHSPRSNDFNMTTLAIRGSRHHNGVSRIHMGVSEQMLSDLWPQVPPEENPVDYITNGVHALTFLSSEWRNVFDRFLGSDWTEHLTDTEYWKRVDAIPDHVFWSTRQYLKSQMLHLVRHRLRRQLMRNRGNESHLDRLFRLADPDNPNVLTIGFGRRFATYKRATLLFEDLELLKKIVNDSDRPVLLIYAGKAHPADRPGQDMIREIIHVAKMPEFEGKLLLIEGYDLRLARRMVSGVDVWLNNPVHPLEASGTSGMKAAMNGVLNLSVLDGWWDEGYQKGNGWAIKPAGGYQDQDRRDHEEARTLYELLQDQVIPLYYNRGPGAYSAGWVTMAKQSIATLLPRFSARRMMGEYIHKFYRPAAALGRQYHADGLQRARDVAQWKQRIHQAWPGVGMRRIDPPQTRIAFGDAVEMSVALRLNGLAPGDVAVEIVLRNGPDMQGARHEQRLFFDPAGQMSPEEERYVLQLAPEHCGKLDYRIRAYPRHPLLAHPHETGLMLWL